jgi:hypothetical protein
METRLNPTRTADISTTTTAPRATPADQTGTRFADVVSRTAVAGAEQAATMVPGAPIMAVALRSGFQSLPMPGRTPMTTMGPAAIAGAPAAAGAGAEGPVAVATSPAGEGGVESSLAQAQEMNLYFLQIQEQVNAQNRSFTTLSNVLKAEHDTVKTAIGNIR